MNFTSTSPIARDLGGKSKNPRSSDAGAGPGLCTVRCPLLMLTCWVGLWAELYPCRPLADPVSSGGRRGLWSRRLRDPWVVVSSVGSGLRARAKARGCDAASSQAPTCLSLRENSRGNTGSREMARAPPRPWVSPGSESWRLNQELRVSEPPLRCRQPGRPLRAAHECLPRQHHPRTALLPSHISPVSSQTSILPPTCTSGPHLLKIFQ